MEIATKKNMSVNGHHKNAKFICADVRSPDLSFPEGSFDLIFSNWLLIYLSDNEVENFAERMMKWLKVGGYIFFRESCFRSGGDLISKINNPCHYRGPRFYTKVFKECHLQNCSGNSYVLALISCKCLGTYVSIKKEGNQICWLWQKVRSDYDKGLLKFLDTDYTFTRILLHERVIGKGFITAGGADTTKEFVGKLDLKPGQKVLDIGCGIGGGDIYMAETFDVHVVGIDVSINMVCLAIERAIALECGVEFEVADCTNKKYPDATFDAVYSRDTIFQIQEKPSLFKSFYKWLKPGGKILISDYCLSGDTPPSAEFAAYIKTKGYDLHDIRAYGQMLRDAGFSEVIAENRTDKFIEVLKKELNEVDKDKERFAEFSKEDYNETVGDWKSKLERSSSGEQSWGLFLAKKT